MTDISLSVGIETGKARTDVLALARTLNDIEEAVNKINSIKSPLKNFSSGVKETTNQTKTYVSSINSILNKHDKFGQQVKQLTKDQKSLKEALKSGEITTGQYNRAMTALESSLKKARFETNAGAKAVRELAEQRKKEAEIAKKAADVQEKAAKKAAQAASRDYLKAANERLKMHNRVVAAAQKEEMVEARTKKAVSDVAAREYLKAAQSRLKMHQTILKANAKEQADANKAYLAQARARIKSYQDSQRAADGYAGALGRVGRGGYRASSSIRENNALLSDQVGFWRFAIRGAALYFSSLATDRLVATNLELQGLEQALSVIGGSSESGAESMEYLYGVADQLGLSVQSLGQGFKGLSAATKGTSLEGEATRAIFESVAGAASVMKLSTSDTEGVMRALEQIMSKGKVSSEELRQQLGDRLPGAFQLAADAMGVTTAELNKMLENGEVISEDFLPKFAKAMVNNFEVTAEAVNGPSQAINRMKNSFSEAARDIGKAGLDEAIIKISNKLADLTETEAFQKAVETLGDTLVWVADNFENLTDAAGVLLAALGVNTMYRTGQDAFYMAQGLNKSFKEASLLGKALQGVFAVATAGAVGFQIGQILTDSFNEARLAGSFLLQSILNTWEGIKLGAEVVWNGVELIVKGVLAAVGGFFIKAADGWLRIFESVASGIDNLFGSNLSASLEGARTSMDSFMKSVDDEALAQLKTETEAISGAYDTFKKNVAENNQIFAEQQDLFRKQGEEADKAGVSIGEYIKNQNNASDSTDKLSDRSERLNRVLSQTFNASGGLSALKGLEDGLEAITDAAGNVDSDAKKVQKLKEELAEIVKLQGDSKTKGSFAFAEQAALDNIKELESNLADASKAIEGLDKNSKEFGKGDAQVSRYQAAIKKTKEELEKARKVFEKAGLSVELINKEIEKLSRSDAKKAFDKATEALDEQQTKIDQSIASFTALEGEQISAATAAAILEDETGKYTEQLIEQEKKLAKSKKALEDLKEAYKIKEDIQDAREELENQNKALTFLENNISDYTTSAEAYAIATKIAAGYTREQAEEMYNLEEASKKANESLEKTASAAKTAGERISELFKSGGTFSFDNLAESFGQTLANGVITQDWKAVGASLVTSLGDGIGTLAGTAIGGPIGGAIGSVVGSLGSLAADAIFGGEYVDPTAERQATQGTGTVLGDIDEKSKSISKSVELISEINSEMVDVNYEMLTSLQNIESGILGIVTDIAKEFGDIDFSVPQIDQAAGQALSGAVIGGVGLGSLGAGFGGIAGSIPGALEALGAGGLSDIASDFLNIISFGLFDEMGKLLGGKSKKVDEGVRILGGPINEIIDGTLVEAFASYKVKKHAFDDYDTKNVFADLGEDINNQVGNVLTSMIDAVTVGAEILGQTPSDIQSALDGFVIETQKISLEGLSPEEQAAELNAVFSTIFDDLTEAVIPNLNDFQMAGESLGDTLTRVSTGLQLVDKVASQLGFAGANGPNTLESSTALIEDAGGLSDFSLKVSSFVDDFFTESQKFAMQSEQFGKTIEALGLPLFDSRQAVLDFIKTQDIGTQSGRDNINAILSNQEALDSYFSSVEGYTEEITSLYDKFLKREPDAEGLKYYLDQLEAGALSIEDVAKIIEGSFEAIEAAKPDLEETLESVSDLFENILGREPDTAGLDYYTEAIRNGDLTLEEVGENMANSAEAIGNSLTELYEEVLGREPDTEGLEAYIQAIQNGDITLEHVAQAMAGSFEALAPKLQAVAEDVLGREFDTAGLEYYIDAIQQGSLTYEEAVKQIANSEEALLHAAAPEKRQLQIKIAELMNDSEEALRLTREAQLEGTNELNRDLLKQVFALEDAAEAQEHAANIRSLEIQLMEAQGDELGALALKRQDELAAVTEEEAAILKQIYAIEDITRARNEELKLANLQIRLLKAQEKDTEALALTRKLELESATDAEKALLRQIYAAEDLANAKKEADEAEEERVKTLADVRNELNSAYQDEISNLESMADKLGGLSQDLRDFDLELLTGDLSVLSPRQQYAVARGEFLETSRAAQAGDIGAIERLQSVSEAFLEKSREGFGSAGNYAEDFQAVRDAVNNSATVAEIQAQQAESQRALLEAQLVKQDETLEENKTLRQVVEALLATQKESGQLSLEELAAIRESLAVLESNSDLANAV